MNTQTLQHTLSHMLHQLREEYAHVDAAILAMEASLQNQVHAMGRATVKTTRPAKEAKSSGSGGRSSAGWTDDARAQVAKRMRAYWHTWREARAQHPAPRVAQKHTPPAAMTPQGRSTAGWTPQARQEAAARMRARWHERRQASQSPP